MRRWGTPHPLYPFIKSNYASWFCLPATCSSGSSVSTTAVRRPRQWLHFPYMVTLNIGFKRVGKAAVTFRPFDVGTHRFLADAVETDGFTIKSVATKPYPMDFQSSNYVPGVVTASGTDDGEGRIVETLNAYLAAKIRKLQCEALGTDSQAMRVVLVPRDLHGQYGFGAMLGENSMLAFLHISCFDQKRELKAMHAQIAQLQRLNEEAKQAALPLAIAAASVSEHRSPMNQQPVVVKQELGELVGRSREYDRHSRHHRSHSRSRSRSRSGHDDGHSRGHIAVRERFCDMDKHHDRRHGRSDDRGGGGGGGQRGLCRDGHLGGRTVDQEGGSCQHSWQHDRSRGRGVENDWDCGRSRDRERERSWKLEPHRSLLRGRSRSPGRERDHWQHERGHSREWERERGRSRERERERGEYERDSGRKRGRDGSGDRDAWANPPVSPCGRVSGIPGGMWDTKPRSTQEAVQLDHTTRYSSGREHCKHGSKCMRPGCHVLHPGGQDHHGISAKHGLAGPGVRIDLSSLSDVLGNDAQTLIWQNGKGETQSASQIRSRGPSAKLTQLLDDSFSRRITLAKIRSLLRADFERSVNSIFIVNMVSLRSYIELFPAHFRIDSGSEHGVADENYVSLVRDRDRASEPSTSGREVTLDGGGGGGEGIDSDGIVDREVGSYCTLCNAKLTCKSGSDAATLHANGQAHRTACAVVPISTTPISTIDMSSLAAVLANNAFKKIWRPSGTSNDKIGSAVAQIRSCGPSPELSRVIDGAAVNGRVPMTEVIALLRAEFGSSVNMMSLRLYIELFPEHFRCDRESDDGDESGHEPSSTRFYISLVRASEPSTSGREVTFDGGGGGGEGIDSDGIVDREVGSYCTLCNVKLSCKSGSDTATLHSSGQAHRDMAERLQSHSSCPMSQKKARTTVVRCRYNQAPGGCSNSGCQFDHTLCKYDPRCKRRDTCRFAHSDTSAHPQRPGKPACSYFLQHGTCGYGMSCKFHHQPPPQDFSGLLASFSTSTKTPVPASYRGALPTGR